MCVALICSIVKVLMSAALESGCLLGEKSIDKRTLQHLKAESSGAVGFNKKEKDSLTGAKNKKSKISRDVKGKS